VDQSQSTDLALYTSFINSCDYTTSTWAVALEDLVVWNPSLDSTNCTMKPGFSYCVLKDENYKRSKQHAPKYPSHCYSVLTCESDVTDSYNSPCMSVVDPAKIPQGTESTCSCFAQVNGEDYPDFGKF
jgi:hypothetical protein